MEYTKRILDILSEGPATLDYLTAEVGPSIPPGKAYRRAIKNREGIRLRRPYNPAKNYRPPSMEQTIRTGHRLIVASVVKSWVDRGKAERGSIKGRVAFRLCDESKE